MIFSTFNQLNCFLIFIFLGIICAVVFDLFSIIFLKKYQKNFLKLLFDTIIYGFFSVIFIIFENIFNFGIFSLSLVLAFLIGFIFTCHLNIKLVVFLEDKWYNVINKKHRESNGESKSKES